MTPLDELWRQADAVLAAIKQLRNAAYGRDRELEDALRDMDRASGPRLTRRTPIGVER